MLKKCNVRLLAFLVCVLTIISLILTACDSAQQPENSSEAVSSAESSVNEPSSVEPSSNEPSSAEEPSSEGEISTEESEISSEFPSEIPDDNSEEPSEEQSEPTSVTDDDPYRYLRAPIRFDDIEYERPDFDLLAHSIENIRRMYEEKEPAEDILEALESLNDAMWEAVTASEYMTLAQHLNTANAFAAQEVVFLTEELSAIQQQFFLLCDTLLDSYCADVVFADFTEDEIEEIRDNARMMDDEYIELVAEIAYCNTSYNSHMSMTCLVGDEEMTLQQVLDNYGIGTYYYALNLVTGDIYLSTVEAQKKLAAKAGYDSYAEYAYEKSFSRDFTPNDASKLHEYVKKYIVPLYSRLIEQGDEDYVAEVDCSPLNFDDELSAYFASISPDMADAYNYMKEYGLYRIANDDNMSSGAFTSFLTCYDIPFIFEHTSGDYGDLTTFVHEFGHFYSYYLLGENSVSSIDIAEIHSQTNEMLFFPVYASLFGEDAYEKIVSYQLCKSLYSLISACMFDEFEQTIFAGDYTTVELINKAFGEICAEYNMPYPDYLWSAIQHLYLYPGYYISYGTSIIPTLELYAISIEDRDSAIEQYNTLIRAGTSETEFLELLAESGLSNPFDEKTIMSIVDIISSSIG